MIDYTTIAIKASQHSLYCVVNKVTDGSIRLDLTDKDTGKEGTLTLDISKENPLTDERLDKYLKEAKRMLDILA